MKIIKSWRNIGGQKMELHSQLKDQHSEHGEVVTDHEFCLRCGRRLKNAVAREKGYGAVCEKKMKVVDARKLFKT